MLKSEWLKKLLLLPVLIFLAALLTGLYGGVFNIAVCGFAPQYFDHTIARLLFPDASHCVSAALDGWISISNLILPASVILYLVCLLVPKAKQSFWAFIRTIGLLTTVTFVVDVTALVIDDVWLAQLLGFDDLIEDADPKTLALLGYWMLQNATQFGVLAGTICGCAYLLFKAYRLRKAD